MQINVQMVRDLIERQLLEHQDPPAPNHNQHPEVKDLRSKGYSVYVSKVHRDDPHVIHEVEKGNHSVTVIRHEGDGKYRIRTGGFGALSKTSYDTLHGAVKSAMRVKNTKKYPSIDRSW